MHHWIRHNGTHDQTGIKQQVQSQPAPVCLATALATEHINAVACILQNEKCQPQRKQCAAVKRTGFQRVQPVTAQDDQCAELHQKSACQRQPGQCLFRAQLFQEQSCTIGQCRQHKFCQRSHPAAAEQEKDADSQHDFPFPAAWCQIIDSHGNGQKEKQKGERCKLHRCSPVQ